MQNALSHFLSLAVTQGLIAETLVILSVAFGISLFIRQVAIALVARPETPDGLKILFRLLKNHAPLFVMILAGLRALQGFLTAYQKNFHVFDLHVVTRLQSLVVIVGVGWIVLKWQRQWVKHLIEAAAAAKDRNRQMTTMVIGQVTTFAVSVVMASALLDLIGIPISTLLAFGGVGGLALSWAAKDFFANFFGGFMIYTQRSFSVGDWIRSPNKNFEGVVEDIGWYRTQILTLDQRPTYVPNAIITDAIIENPGRMPNRRMVFRLSIRYDDMKHVDSITNKIRHQMHLHPHVAKDVLMVNLVEFSSNAVEIEIYAFSKIVDAPDFRRVQQEVLLMCADVVASHGAQFAYPTRTLYVDNLTSDKNIKG